MKRQLILGEISSKVDELAVAAGLNINGYEKRPLVERVTFVGIMAKMGGDKQVADACEAWLKIIVA